MNLAVTTAVILAGGLGTRLRSLVADRPKPMALVAGRPFLEHVLAYWRSQGIMRFVLSVGYRSEMIVEYFGSVFEGCAIDYVVEPEPLGTGGALLLCQKQLQLSVPFLLLNGDTFFAMSLAELQKQAEIHDADWAFSLFPTNEKRRYLAARVEDSGRLYLQMEGEDFRETAESSHWANAGAYLVNPKALDPFMHCALPISLETEIFPQAQELGQVLCGVRSEATFIDIGVPADYVRAQAMSCFVNF